MASGPIITWQRFGETIETVTDFILGSSKITADGEYSLEIKRYLLLGRKTMTNLESVFIARGPYSQSYGSSNSHVQLWELDHKGGWAPESWCFPTMVLEKTLESPLDCKEIKPINPKGEQPWIFIGRTAAETEAPVLCGHLMRWLGSITNSMKFEQTLGDNGG